MLFHIAHNCGSVRAGGARSTNQAGFDISSLQCGLLVRFRCLQGWGISPRPVHILPQTNSIITRRPTIAAARCKLASVMSLFGFNNRSACVRLVFSSAAILFFDVFCFFMASSSCHAATSLTASARRPRGRSSLILLETTQATVALACFRERQVRTLLLSRSSTTEYYSTPHSRTTRIFATNRHPLVSTTYELFVISFSPLTLLFSIYYELLAKNTPG